MALLLNRWNIENALWQQLLPFGSPQMIKDEVKRRIEILGKDGGYIIAPAHNIQPDTSNENMLAFFDAVLNPY